jgi:prolyl-tRNA editing enzyme YbaK/EbsC (Cys-tRNA(Pro) deacylase)
VCKRTRRRYGCGVWPEPVQRVANFLRAAGVDARLEEFPEGTPTARDAAEAAGAELAQIVKSIVFVCDELPVLVLVPGDRRADDEKVAAAVGRPQARVATSDEVVAATGFGPGAVAPFPLRGITHVLIDRTLFAHEYVWIGAGSPNHLARIRPADLAELARARQMDAVAGAKYHSG